MKNTKFIPVNNFPLEVKGNVEEFSEEFYTFKECYDYIKFCLKNDIMETCKLLNRKELVEVLEFARKKLTEI